MKKIIYFFILLLLIATFSFSYKIISGQYDKQNSLILKIKEIVPLELKNYLRSSIYNLRANINKKDIQTLNQAKKNQGLNGKLIQSKKIKSELDSKKYTIREFFLPFERLDLTYGWAAIQNSKRAHYLETFSDKTIVASGEGEFIFFETRNLNLNKLDQKIIKSNFLQTIKKENFTFIGLRDLLIDNEKLYVSVILQDINKNYTISIMSSKFNFEKLEFEFFFNSKLNTTNFSIGTGGRIVSYQDNKLLFTIGHLGFLDEIQDPGHLAGKIISIDKYDQSYELISLGHRNHQGLFYYKDKMNNQFIINSEHGPKGGDEINVNNLKNNKIYNFGWPIASYGINYDGSNPFKSSHKEHGYDEPLINFTPSIGISEISIKNDVDFNTIYASSLRAKSIYIVEADKKFSKVINTDRLILDHRIRDLKYLKNLDGFIVIFENTPSIGFIKSYD
tara:strand:- start:3934 stop:5277 length:1344 start_codon:yes stop_codon:yes gene_type:complete